MTVKQVTKVVSNIVECGSCNCKNALICIASEATPELIPGLFALPATISGCKAIYDVVGETVEKDSCGRTVVSKVMKISTELTLSYESNNFVDPTDTLSTDDVSCVSTDSCMVRAFDNLSAYSANGWTDYTALITSNGVALSTGTVVSARTKENNNARDVNVNFSITLVGNDATVIYVSLPEVPAYDTTGVARRGITGMDLVALIDVSQNKLLIQKTDLSAFAAGTYAISTTVSYEVA